MSGRKAGAARLCDLDPGQVAREAETRMVAHLHELAKQLGGAIIEQHGCVYVGLQPYVARLCWYAQTGTHDRVRGLIGVRNDILAATFCLHASVMRPYSVSLDTRPTDPIDIVLFASRARLTLDGGDVGSGVTAQQLAVLAGVEVQHVRHVARKGELRLHAGMVSVTDARRWLCDRGVPGFPEAVSPRG